ncbi:MAG: efflux transporter outer membrane subunit [Desulfocapsaceae bacterium]|nr:efflux transporter outer membrane subunit [Desulfocapsaceae bacterium]
MEIEGTKSRSFKGRRQRRLHLLPKNMNNIKLPVLLCALLSLLNGCAVGPDYVRPATTSPVAYKETAGWKVAAPADTLIKGAWWEIYNNPELNALQEQVTISNQNLAVAEAQFRQAKALVQGTRAAFFPVVGTAATPSRTDTLSTSNGSTTRQTTTNYLLTGSVSWEIDIWGKTRRAVEASEASAQASAADLGAMRLSMQSSLMQDYFQLRTLDGQKQLLDLTAAEYQKFLDITKNRYKAGVASQTDVLNAQTQLSNTMAQALDTTVQRSQLEHAIAVLIGKPASSFSLPVAPLVLNPPAIPIGLPSDLLERRPDIAAAERNMAAANAQVGVAKAAYYPSISLNGTGGFDSSQFSNWLVWPSRYWSIGSTASETLFNGGLRGAQTDQAIAAFDASVAAYRQTVLTGFQEVEDNLAALRILSQEAKVQDQTVQAARQAAAITLNHYKAGTASSLDVVTTQTLALNSQIAALAINGRLMVAHGLLIKALGGGWDSSSALAPVDAGNEQQKAATGKSDPKTTAATGIPGTSMD